jgi:hypothetical protein
MLRKIIVVLLILPGLFCTTIMAQKPEKQYRAVRTTAAPKIDGILSDAAWEQAPPITDFIQYAPHTGQEPTQKTVVKMLYDDRAIYLSAMMYDTAPDSIKHELGSRDDGDINADVFKLGIDPYNKRQDAYIFQVFASGVQSEYRVLDGTYNAVWQSAVKISDQGWALEMAIPYSAIRFPTTEVQDWGLQFARNIARSNEYIQWELIPKDAPNGLLYWGNLTGIEHIKSPLRLSVTPFASLYYENSPTEDGSDKRYDNSYGYAAGADLKYGIDDKFTLDLTLLPDFSQVQSDRKVKNLGYEETIYNENRSFFQEGTDLFTRGSLFYTRRIGRTPMDFDNVEGQLNPGERILENPSKVKLLNAVKLSGRNNNGLGMGLFNAITANTWAEVEDSLGNKRKILTEPMTNYNILVADQQLKNNSSIYLINTSTIRDKGYRDGNVTGAGYTFCNKKQSWATDGSFALSQIFTKDSASSDTYDDQLGYRYFLGIRKISGKFQWGISHNNISKTYNAKDLGYFTVTNKMKNRLYFCYNVYEPTKTYRWMYNTLTIDFISNPIKGKMTPGTQITFDHNMQFLNYWNMNCGGGFSPFETVDYDEPREDGRFNKSYRFYYLYAGFSTDFRKAFGVSMNFSISNFLDRFKTEAYNPYLYMRYRISDRLSLTYEGSFNSDRYNFGYVNQDEFGNIIFGVRKMMVLVNTIGGRYMFMNDMYAEINVRHYWNTCNYRQYFTLLENGDLADNTVYSENNNFNYNVFNVDFIYSWQFAPGSQLSLVYKNAIENQESDLTYNFYKDLKHTLSAPQTNSISLKVLYYLDFQYFRKRNAHHK